MVSLEVQNISFRIQSLGLGSLEFLRWGANICRCGRNTRMLLRVRDDSAWGLLIDLPSFQGDLDGIKPGLGRSALE